MKPIHLVTFLALVFGFFVWPTPFWYEKINTGSGRQQIHRINRFTGEVTRMNP